MICQLCGGQDIIQISSNKYLCSLCKDVFNNPHMLVRKCQRCGDVFLTIPPIESTVLNLVYRTKSNIKTYWRVNQCPECIVKGIREAYVKRYHHDWNIPPLDWWGENNEATISVLIKWGLEKVLVTRYELENPGVPEYSPIPPKFIKFCLTHA